MRLARLRERIRTVLYRRAKSRVLVLGDSHVRVFEDWRFLFYLPHTRFDIVYVPGATAYGIRNRRSETNAYNIFTNALAEKACDLVLVNLGEVDTACTLWRQAGQTGQDVTELAIVAIENYCDFLAEIRMHHRVVVISACLPTLADHALASDDVSRARQTVKISQSDRTSLALDFNRQVAQFCEHNNILFLSSDAAAIGDDGLVRQDWLNPERHDHHYARAPYAKWLIAALSRTELAQIPACIKRD